MGGVREGSFNSATSSFQLPWTALLLGEIICGNFPPTLCLCQEQTIVDIFDAFANRKIIHIHKIKLLRLASLGK